MEFENYIVKGIFGLSYDHFGEKCNIQERHKRRFI